MGVANGNLGNGELLSTSILQKAKELPLGCYTYRLSGDNYSGNDLPNASYQFGTCTIYKRQIDSIIVIAYAPSQRNPMQINVVDGHDWLGWQSYITNSDLESLSAIHSPVFNGDSYSDIDAAVKACVDSLPNTDNLTTYFRTVYHSSYYRAIIQKYSNANYASAIVFSYNLATPRYYRKNAGVWNEARDL